MDIVFAEHLDLLDLHGRAAVASLAQLGPADTLPPHGVPAHAATREHWATLEIWAWTLEHPGRYWSQRVEPSPPQAHGDVVAAIATEISHLEDLLLATGPEADLDFFGRPGTTGDVARLLAHEAVGVAHAASLAAGRGAPMVTPAVAADGIDRALGHWAEPDADVMWQPRPALLRATDTADEWPVCFGQDRRGDVGAVRPGAGGEPVVVVAGPATALLWWLHDHEVGEHVTLSGEPDAVRILRRSLDHEIEPVPRRRGWRRR
ncbi:hypothetical protein [Nocardioides sp. Soil805]|uniref:hypothetical protein n=1 Tax=Nocardioides sp. Soil805 TaxID=1736416 RepID=UPI000703032E|nr:hypothetical protein [Nocardioides sp. Soil805]KRF35938.1 hypothetical protein ASG94_00070 [Nocardioides sp. Soil805]